MTVREIAHVTAPLRTVRKLEVDQVSDTVAKALEQAEHAAVLFS